MGNSSIFRLRITFAKTDAMRFTGHLDLHRTWERSFRRAELPLAYSQGYNPRPRLNLASALPLGCTSSAEIIDAWLEKDMDPGIIWQSLEKAVPPGIELLRIEKVDLSQPALQRMLEASDYIIRFLEPVQNLDVKISRLLSETELIRRRRNKDYNLRPLIHSIKILSDEISLEIKQGYQQILVRLSAMESATGRPDEVVEALGVAPQDVRIQRIHLVFHGDQQ